MSSNRMIYLPLGGAGEIGMNVYVYGYGWPVYRGGPMHYANSLGLDRVLERIRHYHQLTDSDFWEPSPLLVSLAEKGEQFS